MKTKNYLQIAKFLIKIEKQAYANVKKQKVEVKDKKAHDLVTNMDTGIEKCLLSKLNEKFPEIKVVSEEFNSSVKAEGTYFVIDPVDGTINFANKIPIWGIQIAYIENDEIVASAIFMPEYAQFFAAKGFGAYKNGKQFFVQQNELKHCILCADNTHIDEYILLTENLNEKVLKPRNFGAACYELALTAEGKIGVYIVHGNAHPWDIYPGFLLAKEAGCYIGETEKHKIVSCSEENLKQVLKIIKKIKMPE